MRDCFDRNVSEQQFTGGMMCKVIVHIQDYHSYLSVSFSNYCISKMFDKLLQLKT